MRKKTSARSARVFAQNRGAVLAVIVILAGELTFEKSTRKCRNAHFMTWDMLDFSKTCFLKKLPPIGEGPGPGPAPTGGPGPGPGPKTHKTCKNTYKTHKNAYKTHENAYKHMKTHINK